MTLESPVRGAGPHGWLRSPEVVIRLDVQKR